MQILKKIWAWTAGKKTYAAALALLILAIFLAHAGADALAASLVCAALGFVGVRDNANRKAEMVMKAVRDLETAIQTKNVVPLAEDAVEMISDARLAQACAPASQSTETARAGEENR